MQKPDKVIYKQLDFIISKHERLFLNLLLVSFTPTLLWLSGHDAPLALLWFEFGSALCPVANKTLHEHDESYSVELSSKSFQQRDPKMDQTLSSSKTRDEL